MEVKKPVVSVVIPTYNNSGVIGDCLKSVAGSDYPKEDFEVVVVDDGSRDDTRDVVGKFVEGSGNIKYIYQENRGPAAARNAGIRNARGDFILLTDADCVVPKDWIKRMLEALKESDVVGGSLTPASSETLYEEFEQSRRDRLYGAQKKFVDLLPSCNLAFPKRIWTEVNGFDESFRYPSFEDYDYCKRIRNKGYRILYDPSIGVVHKHSTNLKGIIRRAFVHGKESILYKRKMKGSMLLEQVRLFAKVVAIPYFTLTRYKTKFMLLGFLYETITVVGQEYGIIYYSSR